MRPAWTQGVIKKFFPKSPTSGQITQWPVIGKRIGRFLFGEDHYIYLPQDNIVPINKKVDSPENVVLPSEVIEQFIDKACYLWIMDKCMCRDAMQCKDYPIDMGCLFLGQGARGINPKVGRPVSKDEARDFLKRVREAGLVHMVTRSKLDRLWLGIGPGEKLMAVCNCCPCCCIVRLRAYTNEKVKSVFHRMPGVNVTVNDKCNGCEICLSDVCFTQAIHMENGCAVIGNDCLGCGRCVSLCPQDAIELSVKNEDYVDETIVQMTQKIDVT